MEQILTYGQILTIFTLSTIITQICWKIELFEVFEDLVEEKFLQKLALILLSIK
jgi:hypothetical protein